MIVDDHVLIREGLKALLALHDNFKVVAEANSGIEAIGIIDKVKPDIILMDIKMKGISGVETTRLIYEKYPEVKIIMLTIYEDVQYVNDAIQAGAKGYILKKVKRKELYEIIQHVMQNEAFLDPSVTSKLFNHVKNESQQQEKTTKLTGRELDIAKYLAEGKTDNNIAKLFFISEHTVRSHIKMIYKKLNVKSRAQAIVKLIQQKIIVV